jgi:hypothetical protein
MVVSQNRPNRKSNPGFGDLQAPLEAAELAQVK